MLVLGVIDWTTVIVAAISAAASVVAAIFAGSVHRQVRTPSGAPLGHVVEYAHDTAIANNLLLSRTNGPTKPAEPELLKHEAGSPPQVPSELPDDAG